MAVRGCDTARAADHGRGRHRAAHRHERLALAGPSAARTRRTRIHGAFDKVLGWLHVGRVPVLVLLVLFLAAFALTGFALNMVVHRLLGFWVPTLIAVPVAVITALPMVRILGAGLAHVTPAG